MPPVTSKLIPFGARNSANGFQANTIIQPIMIYRMVENSIYFFTKKDLKTVPPRAIPQTIPKIVQRVHPSRAMNKKGVYVPAIKK